jgi:hypothetical protein
MSEYKLYRSVDETCKVGGDVCELLKQIERMDGLLICCHRTLCQKSSPFVRKEAKRLLQEYIDLTCPRFVAPVRRGKKVKTHIAIPEWRA